jgi:hypothetical protein
MKINHTLLLFLLTTVSILAQTSEKMSYQAVIRDASNMLLTNQVVGMQISILQTTITGTAVYTETQTVTTNINGLVSLAIGVGASSRNFSAIDWSAGPYFIKIGTDPSGGSSYSITGTSQIMSVPFAMYAKTAGSSIPGPQGDTGVKGAAGTKGIQGEIGLAGLDGINGADGIQGETGAAGLDGINGVDGINGADGIQGETGSAGLDGINGVDGIQGETGSAGVDGINGADGNQGEIGLAGVDGINGVDGADGIQGETGSAGLDGVDGIQGETGLAGVDGINGADGIQGEIGLAGVDGINGADGIQGETGSAGLDGINGADGIQGETGAAGVDGINGADGNQGEIGLAGLDGINGADGNQGETGAAGVDGINGADGTNGVQGPAGTAGVGIAQTLSFTSSNLELSDSGGSIDLTGLINDADSDISNELQSLEEVLIKGNNAAAQLKNVTDPTDAQDAATKAYVDALIAVLEARIDVLYCEENGVNAPSLANLFSIVGSASFINSNEIELTPDLNYKVGSSMSFGKLDFNYDFNFSIEINLGNKNNGADGLSIVFHNDPNGANTIGEFGQGVGSKGIRNGIAIEFDTWYNAGDLANDHTQIKNTSNGIGLTSMTDLGNIEDGNWYSVNFSWVASSNTLSYSFNGVLIANYTDDLISNVFNGESKVHLGFTAGTGGATNIHKIRLSNALCSYPLFLDTDGENIQND